jgi:hypothetical protein
MRSFVSLAIALSIAAPASADQKYYLVMRGVDGAADVPHDVVKKLLVEEIARHPEEFTPERADFPSEPGQLADKLAAERLKGYYVTVKLIDAKRTLTDPGPGRRAQLQRSIRLSLVGATIPEQTVAFGGVGESTAAVDVGKKVSDADESGVLADALKDAISQAITNSIAKLKEIAKGTRAAAKKKKPAKTPTP